jgi:hypothetical protein
VIASFDFAGNDLVASPPIFTSDPVTVMASPVANSKWFEVT